MRLFSYRNRPVHLGPYPSEKLARMVSMPDLSQLHPTEPLAMAPNRDPHSIGHAINDYLCLLDASREGPAGAHEAQIPVQSDERARHLKAAGYFLDSSVMGSCELAVEDHLCEPFRNPKLQQLLNELGSAGEIHLRVNTDAIEQQLRASIENDSKSIKHHTHALIVVVEYPREPGKEESGAQWIQGVQAQRAAVRAAETASVLSHYIRILGFETRVHSATSADVDLNRLAVKAGVATIEKDGSVSNPFLGSRFGLAAITTTMELQPDRPLDKQGIVDKLKSHGPAWWLGYGSYKNASNALAFRGRDFKDSRYRTEKTKRRDAPTTLLDQQHIPRLPKRSSFFVRAAFGDLGKPPQQASIDHFMVTKAPLSAACVGILNVYTRLQRLQASAARQPGYDDPQKNSEIIKATLHFMGVDQVGICEAPEWAWYSHGEDGKPINAVHPNAIVLLIDQGHESMEGASGDDWVSCTQSMRAYMRASLLGGVVAQQLRNLGFNATNHTAADGDIIHPPLVLLSGLGEVSRIGDVVLNPHMGPRLKTGVVTTDFPMSTDKPIDFGLQKFCDGCNKCARECPSGAITAGPKVVYNGYEIWKSDQEKCTRYRMTNDAGAMCGRCMKTCPWNLEGIFKESPFRWLATNVPSVAPWLAHLDDVLGNGKINPVKKWWWDIRTDTDGQTLIATDVNERGLNTNIKLTPEDQTLACYPAKLAPPPYPAPYPVDREAGISAYRELPSPDEYREKLVKQDLDGIVQQYNVPNEPPPVFPVRIKEKKISSADGKVAIYSLISIDGSPLPKFHAGAHIDVTVDPAHIRQYSLAGDPGDSSQYLIGVLREDVGRGGSKRLHERLQEGQPVIVSRPRNHFPLENHEGRSLLMAGGIGVTPMIAMAHELYAKGREFTLYYKAKKRSNAGFIEELQNFPWSDRVHFHFSDENRLNVADVLGDYRQGDQLYTCGPAEFMDVVFETAARLAWDEDALHREYFTVPDQGDYKNYAFSLLMKKSGIEVRVSETQSAAEALQEAGVAVDTKCSDGLCGVCCADYVEGEVEHRDYVLSKGEQEQRMVLCCSRAKAEDGQIVLDI